MRTWQEAVARETSHGRFGDGITARRGYGQVRGQGISSPRFFTRGRAAWSCFLDRTARNSQQEVNAQLRAEAAQRAQDALDAGPDANQVHSGNIKNS
jgi:hypothetical protein